MHTIYVYSFVYNGKSNSICYFSVKPPNIRENRVKMEHLSQFSDKNDEKVAHEKACLLKLEFYNTDWKEEKCH